MVSGSTTNKLVEQVFAPHKHMEFHELQRIVESNAKSITALANTSQEQANVLAEAVGRAARSVEVLSQAVEEDRVNFQEYRERNDANVASLNAAVERLEAIVAYLVRRDGE